jgi:hypothetical protein
MEGGMAVAIPGAMAVAVNFNVLTALLSDIALCARVWFCVCCVCHSVRHGCRCRFPATICSKAQILLSQCPSKSTIYRPCRDYFSDFVPVNGLIAMAGRMSTAL